MGFLGDEERFIVYEILAVDFAAILGRPVWHSHERVLFHVYPISYF